MIWKSSRKKRKKLKANDGIKESSTRALFFSFSLAKMLVNTHFVHNFVTIFMTGFMTVFRLCLFCFLKWLQNGYKKVAMSKMKIDGLQKQS